jgi:putative sterol carrier protein
MSHNSQRINSLFDNLLQKLNDVHTEDAGAVWSTLQFVVDKKCWYFTNTPSIVELKCYSFEENGGRAMKAACNLTTDTATMMKLCRGDISVMNAYLSRKYKIFGDQHVFKSISSQLKEALLIVKDSHYEDENVSPQNSNKLQGSRNTLTSRDLVIIHARPFQATKVH